MKLKNFKMKRYLLYLFLINFFILLISLIYAGYTERCIQEGRDAVFCFVKERMKIYCPGCGGSRSLVALLHFDILKSFILFPALPISALMLLGFDILSLACIVREDFSLLNKFSPNLLLIIPITIFISFILKNLLLYFFGIDIIGDFTKIIS